MGASPEEYTRLAPHHSFLHVDQFKGPRELAEYLLELDGDDEKYNEYFQVQNKWEELFLIFYLPVACQVFYEGFLHWAPLTQCLFSNEFPFNKHLVRVK